MLNAADNQTTTATRAPDINRRGKPKAHPKPTTTTTKPFIFALTLSLSVCLLLMQLSAPFVACNNKDVDNHIASSLEDNDDATAIDDDFAGASTADDSSTSTVAPQEDSAAKAKSYTSPQLKPENIYLFETFDDKQKFDENWVASTNENYKGKWQIESGPDRPAADRQLLLPLKARHYAIGSKLNPPFKFIDNKPLVVQYEVEYREGNDCGGSYLKMLRMSDSVDLTQVDDKTPYSVMFGPDKCGSDAKIHFIVQYKNPVTQKYEEKHWKGAKSIPDLLAVFNDKNSHLFKLVLDPNNDFQVFLDDKSVGKGNLLEDLEPAINPPKEIVDETDKKPANWEDRTHIDDPNDKKPADWDEDEPKKIPDPSAVKPADWLDDEQPLIPDASAKKPDDWEEMDGDWTPPLIENPKCGKLSSGCGEWKAPLIDNPKYKGKWVAKKIKNPAYKGKWEPRMIPNPAYFHDENPFKSLDAIGAVSYELWSMADDVAFDNLIVTSNAGTANLLQFLTWQERRSQSDAASPSITTRAMHYLKVHPWLWAFVLLAVVLPLVLVIAYCCDYSGAKRRAAEAAERKKTDKSRKDDEEEELVDECDSNATSKSGNAASNAEEEEEEDDDGDVNDDDAVDDSN